MSVNVGPANFLGRALTPECTGLTKSIKVSSAIVIVVIFIAFVLLTAAVVYNYVKQIKNDADKDSNDAKKKKLVGGMTISSIVVLGVALLSSIWQYTAVSRTSKLCLPA